MKQYKKYTFQLERLPEGMMPEDAFDLVADQLAAKGFESFEYDQEGLIGYLPANEDNFPEKGLFALAFPDVQCRYTSRMLPSETHYNAVWEREEAKPVIVANTLYIRAPHHPPCSGMLKEILIAPHGKPSHYKNDARNAVGSRFARDKRRGRWMRNGDFGYCGSAARRQRYNVYRYG